MRRNARSVLEKLKGSVSYQEIRLKLELHFRKQKLFQHNYTQFTNGRQNNGEDFATLEADLKRLARLAYPECAYEVRKKIACAKFVVALSDRGEADLAAGKYVFAEGRSGADKSDQNYSGE